MHVEKAHSDEITGLKFSSDGRILLSRSFDGLLTVMMKDMSKHILVYFLHRVYVHFVYLLSTFLPMQTFMHVRFGICEK